MKSKIDLVLFQINFWQLFCNLIIDKFNYYKFKCNSFGAICSYKFMVLTKSREGI